MFVIMSKKTRGLIEAHKKGYRVTKCGTKATNPIGKQMSLYLTKRYKSFSFRSSEGVVNIELHRLQGYQKFGDKIKHLFVRHLNGNEMDNSWDNIGIGTHSDNMMDMPKEVRVAKAKHASSFLKKYNHEEVEEFYKSAKSYKKTMEYFGIKSKSTLYNILNK